jgi:superfamily II DNA or RNA helicase
VKVLIATGQLIGEGFDCRDLTTLFLATPISFSGRVLQYLGRVLRPAPGKKVARVFDYVDIHVDTLKKAAIARQKIYRR